MRALILTLFLAMPAAAQDAATLVTAARDQVGVTVCYDPSYTALSFPGGDVPLDRGVCTDVVIRALRTAWGIDLQLAVNRDMTRAFAQYPALWGLTTTDRNIDHRRVPNLQTLFARVGAALPVTTDPAGDHPMALHNIGRGAQEEHVLFAFPITGHYRLADANVDKLRGLGAP